MTQLILRPREIVGVGGKPFGIRHKEPRIETAGSALRRHGAEEIGEGRSVGQIARLGKAAPSLRCVRPIAALTDDVTGFFPKLADRGGGERVRAGAARLHQALFTNRSQGCGKWHRAVVGVNGTAGKDEFLGHENRAFAPLSHKHRGSGITVAHDDNRCGVAYCGFVDGHRPSRSG